MVSYEVLLAAIVGIATLGFFLSRFLAKSALKNGENSSRNDSKLKGPAESKKTKAEKAPEKTSESSENVDKQNAVPVKVSRHSSCIAELKGLPRCSSVAFDPKGRYMAVSCDDRTIRLFQFETLGTNEPRQYKLNVEGDVPCYCRFSPDGHYLLVGLGDSNSFWVYKIFSQRDPVTGKVFELAREYPQRLTKPLVNLQMSANMKYIVTCANDTTLLLWNVKGEVLATLNSRQMGNHMACISPDSSMIAAATLMSDVWKIKEDSKGQFVGVDDKNFTALTGKDGHKSGVNAIAFSQKSMTAITTSKDNTVKKWSLDGDFKLGFEPKVVFTGKNPLQEKNGYGLIAINPDENRVALVSGRNLHVWSIRNENLYQKIESAHGGEITDMMWSFDGQYLATSCTDSTVRIFAV